MALKKRSIYSIINDAKEELVDIGVNPFFGEFFEKNEFCLITSYIANKAYQEKKNIYIGTGSKESTQELTLPILYPIACKLLAENNSSQRPDFNLIKEKYIFIKDSICWEYVLKDGKDALASIVKAGKRFRYFRTPAEVLDNYFVADAAHYSDKKSYRSLRYYQDFYAQLIGTKTQPPSFFAKKIVVVCNKTELIKQLRELCLFHCIPISCIISKHDECTGESQPIDPMILIVSDYGRARDYILEHFEEFRVEYLIMSGDNKIHKLKSQIKNDCANGLFSNYCLVGNHIIPKDNSMVLWHWSKREEKTLRGKHGIEFQMDPFDNCEALVEASNEFFSYLREIFDEYGTVECFEPAKLCFRRIMYDKLCLIKDFMPDLGLALKEEISKSLLSENYDTEEITEFLDELLSKLSKVFNAKFECPLIWDKLSELNLGRLRLVVHNSQYELWLEGLKAYNHSNVTLISFKDFKREIVGRYAHELYIFTFQPSYNQSIWMNSLFLKKKITLRMVLYPPEISMVRALLKKIKKWEMSNSGLKDKKLIPDLDIGTNIREASNDIIGRFEDTYSDYSQEENYKTNDIHGYVAYTIEAVGANDQILVTSCPQKVIRIDDSGMELIVVSDLDEGDRIKLYANKSRESLYEILSEESDKFAQVNSFSRLWKRRLKEYICEKTVVNEEGKKSMLLEQERLQKLALHTGINPDYITKQWIQKSNAVLFPQKSKLDQLLKFFRESKLISIEELEGIRASRGFFVGIMISLGHNLSTEAQSILLNGDSYLDEYISNNVAGNDREYPLLSRLDCEAISSIINHNFQEYRFIRVIEREEDCDEN